MSAPPAPAATVDLAVDRALDLDAVVRPPGSPVDVAPFTAIAGLEPGTAPDETGLFGPLAALATAGTAAPAPTAVPVRVQAPALAAASKYAPQSGGGGALPWADLDATVSRATTASELFASELAAPVAPVAELPMPSVLVEAPAPEVLPAPAPTAPSFAPHAAFASLVDAGPTSAPADPALGLLELADRISADEHSAVVSTETPSFASLMSRLGDDLGVEPAPADPSPAAPVVLEGEATRSVPAQRPAPAAPAAPAAAPAAGTGTAAALAAAPAADPAAAADAEQAAAAELARLGLPAHLQPAGGYGEQLHTALRASLTRLPTAPPAINRAGTVLAVVGPLSLAVAVARGIAQELGLPVATSVALATSGTVTADVPERQVLHATPEAAERRTAWRRRSNLTVVAVDAPLTATGAAEARSFLAALSPTATWGVVEATRKAQDVGAWTRALGGVHALALTDLEDTADPAAVLELGIPVSRLGVRPATPRAWATLLTGRLAA